MKTAVERIAEKLKDRQDYRQMLIQKRNCIDVKIKGVEEQISKLRKGVNPDETAA
jgi:hypothetical protein